MQLCRWCWISNLGALGLSHLAAHQGLFAPLKSKSYEKFAGGSAYRVLFMNLCCSTVKFPAFQLISSVQD